ncbi:MAG TPA: serine/threonine-protein kinase [Gemmatimonadaceae bacterium]|nr:serine/threonine-protein kinase [Gemmatimonadaceae bacterium]
MPERYIGRYLGRFRIDALVGSGGFAWVYKGYDPELDVPVALKVLKPQFAGDEMFETRFRREASTAAKLRHPNIIKILAVGREGEAVYFVMDYLSQGLVDRLRVMGTLPEHMLVRVGFDVASALGFAHRQGVIHRDVKVDNIMFDDHGNAVVTDFGIARAVTKYAEQTGTNMVVGTPQYFSPEQARGLPLDGRADLYSLGVTLFKAATGVLPFQGDDWYEIARQHVEDEPPRPRDLNPSLSKGLERIVLRCLEKEPDERFANGEALCTELSHLLPDRGEVTSARTLMIPATDTLEQTTGRHPVRRAVRRLRRRGVVLATVAAVAAVGVLSATLRSRRPDSEAAAAPITVNSGRSPDSVAPVVVTPPPRPVVEIVAPGEATVSVNGLDVGRGRWRSDTLKPGEYVLAASIRSLTRCGSARAVDTIYVRETGDTTVTLRPLPCGFLAVSSTPEVAEFVVMTPAGSSLRQEMLPYLDSLLLPVGRYRLRVQARYCTEFNDSVRIESGKTNRQHIRMLCETPQEKTGE